MIKILKETQRCHFQMLKEGILPAPYRSYFIFPQRLIFWKRYELALSMIRQGDSALDFGCGNGALVPSLSKMFKSVYAVDTAESKVRATTSTCSRLSITNVNISHVSPGNELRDLRDEMFDCICALDVLEHISHASSVVSEFLRVLKADGYLIVSIPNENLIYRFGQIMIRSKFRKSSHVLTYKQIVEQLGKFFIVEKDRNLAFLFRILSLSKRKENASPFQEQNWS